jgi:DNA-binding PadR family transcriptional regulator
MTTRGLQEATLLVLTALSRGSQHGYGIITDVRQISGGRVRLRAGTLYTALDRLRAAGLIGVDREEVTGGRLRRYYRLTPQPAISAARHHLASGPDLRAGDADREAAAAALGEHFAQGRLTFGELLARLDVTFAATTQREIAETTKDLPHP